MKVTLECSADIVLFNLGQKVQFVLDPEMVGVVTIIKFSSYGVMYNVMWNDMQERCHIPAELSPVKQEGVV